MPTSLVRFVRNFDPDKSPPELATPVSCTVNKVRPGRFELWAEHVSGEQVCVVEVDPELNPERARYMRRKHHRCWPKQRGEPQDPSDVVGFLDAPGQVFKLSQGGLPNIISLDLPAFD